MFDSRTNAEPSIIPLLLRRISLRHWRLAPRQSGLLVMILALGIGVFLAIRLANRAAVSSFRNFTDLVTAGSDWVVTAPAGSLPESVPGELRERLGSAPVHIIPVVETTAVRPEGDDGGGIGSRPTWQLIGIDLLAAGNVAAERGGNGAGFWGGNREGNPDGFWRTFRNPRGVFIADSLARAEGLKVGDELSLLVNDQPVRLVVSGLIPTHPGQPEVPETLLVMDLPALQTVASRTGRLDRVELIVEPGPDEEGRRAGLGTALTAWSEGRWLVSTPADRRESAALMTRAFRFNLTILSLLALLVGLYLIFQALDGAVVRRREEIGILRSLGVDEGTIRRAWLMEATMLGLMGGGLGIVLGWVGAQFAVRVVGRTVNALYHSTSVRSAQLDGAETGIALALAVGVSLLAGWWPARAAATTPPAQILGKHPEMAPTFRWMRRAWVGPAVLLAAVVLSWLPPLRWDEGGRFPLAGYVSALGWIVGGGLVGFMLLRWSAGPVGRIGGGRAWIRLAASHLRRPSGRHGLALAGLVCAVAMSAGMGILVASFETTMQGWIGRTFQADLYVSSAGAQSASTQNRITASTWRTLVADPRVDDVNLIQACEVQLAEGRTVLASGTLRHLEERTRFAWIEKPLTSDIYRADRNATLALVSESFQERFRMGRGARIRLPTPAGGKDLTITGVFADYGNERGSILIDQAHYAAWFGEDQLTSLVVWLKPGTSAEGVRSDWRERHPGLSIYTNAHLRSEILRIFHQTFAITGALEAIGLAVAVIGLGLTLASVLVERRRELTTLRALGMTRSEIAGATACEGLLVAAGGAAAGVAVSLALGWLLIHVINKQTFGWTLEFDCPVGSIAGLVLLVLASGTAVSYGVGRWGAALPADREE